MLSRAQVLWFCQAAMAVLSAMQCFVHTLQSRLHVCNVYDYQLCVLPPLLPAGACHVQRNSALQPGPLL